jgi:hypothetical protein
MTRALTLTLYQPIPSRYQKKLLSQQRYPFLSLTSYRLHPTAHNAGVFEFALRSTSHREAPVTITMVQSAPVPLAEC